MLSYALIYMQVKAAAAVKEFFRDEKGAVDIVAIVILIGIAVILAVVFKNSIKKLIENLLDTIGEKATEAVSN